MFPSKRCTGQTHHPKSFQKIERFFAKSNFVGVQHFGATRLSTCLQNAKRYVDEAHCGGDPLLELAFVVRAAWVEPLPEAKALARLCTNVGERQLNSTCFPKILIFFSKFLGHFFGENLTRMFLGKKSHVRFDELRAVFVSGQTGDEQREEEH